MRKPSPISTSSPREAIDLAALGERGKREQQRRGVVVHDEGRLCTGEVAQMHADVILPRAAHAVGELELEVRVAGGDRVHSRNRGVGERGATEVGVDDDAGRVEDAAQARFEQLLEP